MDSTLDNLNLPSFDIKIGRAPDGSLTLYDPLRQKNVAATPEEWVRQHFVNYLTSHLGFPSAFMANEKGIRLNNTARRCDTVIFSRDLRPVCIVEYKRPQVEISRDVFDQIARYNSVLRCPYLIVSNGLKHFCCRFNGNSYDFLTTIPSFDTMCGE